MEPIELKFPIKQKDKEIKYLTPSRFKVKHFKLIPKSFLEKAETKNGKVEMDFSNYKELIPMFEELIPFLAAIFQVTKEVISNVDFEDIENVMGALDSVFPDDEKKN